MTIVCLALQLFVVLIFLRIILSWFPPTGGFVDQVQRIVFGATEWVMGPLRRVIPPVRLGAAALDLSPMIVLFGIFLIQGVIC
jgi:YggT family protein